MTANTSARAASNYAEVQVATGIKLAVASSLRESTNMDVKENSAFTDVNKEGEQTSTNQRQCPVNSCHYLAACHVTNSYPGFYCGSCPKGMIGDGVKCEDENEVGYKSLTFIFNIEHIL